MPTYSKRSQEQFDTLDPRLQKVLSLILSDGFDHTITDGYRGEEAQNEAVAQGRSTKRFPSGEHNKLPSKAVDVLPYPIEYKALEKGDDLAVLKVGLFAGYFIARAKGLGIKIRWGGDWNMNMDVRDQKFNDWPHFEVED